MIFQAKCQAKIFLLNCLPGLYDLFLLVVDLDTFEARHATKKIEPDAEIVTIFGNECPCKSRRITINEGKVGVLNYHNEAEVNSIFPQFSFLDLSSSSDPEKILDRLRAVTPGSGVASKVNNIPHPPMEIKEGICLLELNTESGLVFETISWKNEKLPTALKSWFKKLEES